MNSKTYDFVEKQTVMAASPLEGILQEAAQSDMIVIGATKEPLFRNLLLGNVAQQVAEQAACPVIVVKQRSSILASVLRETVLAPIRHSPKLPE
jgi:nucleotide-binding universal stress UspA family protein